MGPIDKIKSRIPTFKSNNKTVEFTNPPARGISSKIMIWVSIFGIFSLLMTEIGIAGESLRWVVLGVLMFLLLANPIVRLEGYWEGIVILLMYMNFLGYIFVFHYEHVTNSLMMATCLLVLIVIFEFPRRWNFE